MDKEKDALRYQEELLEAARILDTILETRPGNRPPGYALSLLRDAASAEEAMVAYLRSRIDQAKPGDDAWVGPLRPLVWADVFNIASDFIKAAPAGVNPFLASVVLFALMGAHQDDTENVEGWKGKLKSALSEWVSWDGKRPPGVLPVLFAIALEHGATVDQIAKGRGCKPQTVRTAVSEGRKRLGRPRLRKRTPRLPDYSKD